MRYARKRGLRTDLPWRELDAAEREWVIEGEGDWNEKRWYGRGVYHGSRRRLQDAHPRAAVEIPQLHACPACRARASGRSLLWRLGGAEDAQLALAARRISVRRHHAFR
jgi:excinuclease ABC subunit A